MDAPFRFIIPGDPKPKKRPKVYRWSTVNPSKEDEESVASYFKQLPACPKIPLQGQIRVQFKFFIRPPKATPKWKWKYINQNFLQPNKSPDLDNYVKFILDALNGILWEDDRFIVEIHSAKYYTQIEPRTEILVSELPAPQTRKEADEVFTNIQHDNFDIFFESNEIP
jgi:Holliday junction resolvase RusA-like endonuclease